MGQIRVGTALWTDRALIESGWYPRDASTPEKRLRYYASQFPLIEVDATYYALPSSGPPPPGPRESRPGSPSPSRRSACSPSTPPGLPRYPSTCAQRWSRPTAAGCTSRTSIPPRSIRPGKGSMLGPIPGQGSKSDPAD
jgi:hypothetical protein